MGILAAYQRSMAERMVSTEEEKEGEEEGQGVGRRAGQEVEEGKETLKKKQSHSLDVEGTGGSNPDLLGFSRSQTGRATVCLSDLKKR